MFAMRIVFCFCMRSPWQRRNSSLKKIRCGFRTGFSCSPEICDRGEMEKIIGAREFSHSGNRYRRWKKRITPYPEIPMRKNPRENQLQTIQDKKKSVSAQMLPFIYDSLYSQFFHVYGAKNIRMCFFRNGLYV